jgi:hypothetical protein
LHRKRARERKWANALAALAANPAACQHQLAQLHDVSYTSLNKRWRRYREAQRAGDAARLEECSRIRSGGHNRPFSALQESVLRDIVLQSVPAMGAEQIREAALQLRADIDTLDRRAVHTRSHREFKASDSFITAFKLRQRLSSHRTKLEKQSAKEMERRDTEEECFQYVIAVRSALLEYGAHRVLNMDETPTALCDAPISAVTATGSRHAAPIKTDFLTNHNLTTFPCIAADGTKLQLCAILKGKTDRVFKKVTEGASEHVRRVRLYRSIKGWMTVDVMLQWLRDVVQPYTGGEPAALVLDRYGCHWTPEVQAAAAAMNIELIQVPGGCTAELQPLDVAFNGPMVKARQRIWRANKIARPFDGDSWQAAVERSQLAYESISKATTSSAWIKAQLVDE